MCLILISETDMGLGGAMRGKMDGDGQPTLRIVAFF